MFGLKARIKKLERQLEVIQGIVDHRETLIACSEGRHKWGLAHELKRYGMVADTSKPYIRCENCYAIKPAEVKRACST